MQSLSDFVPATTESAILRYRDLNSGACEQVSPGEVLYYPAYWWHQTKCLDETVIGITGLMVGTELRRDDLRRLPHEEFYLDLRQKCGYVTF